MSKRPDGRSIGAISSRSVPVRRLRVSSARQRASGEDKHRTPTSRVVLVREKARGR